MGGVNAELLARLAPAHAPPPPGWWPPAPGWWAIATLVLLVVAILIYRRRRLSARLRRAALSELRNLESRQSGADDPAELARGLEQLLRRYALAQFGRERVARLSGEAWVEFVVAHGGSSWAGDAGKELLRAAYGGTANVDPQRWISGAREFVKKGRPRP